MSKLSNTKRGAKLLIVVALGIVYGDIATSPMYVMKSIVSGNGGMESLTDDFVLGALSIILWTVTLITTVKYVLIALKADNKGEGGIFALYSLVRKAGKWLIIPAIIGGAALLADGVLTPAVTVTNAIEGLRTLPAINDALGESQTPIILIVIVILLVLFTAQRAGTTFIGRAFGPIMIVWFIFISIAGLFWVVLYPKVFLAFNPMYAVKLLFSPDNHMGIWILGSVFLATTGAEALYSDMGHVGKKSIYVSWVIVKISLILNYLAQCAYLLLLVDTPDAPGRETLLNPFYDMLMPGFDVIGVVLGALAAVIASQALITGSFSIVSEAIHLNLLPPLRTFFPSETKGQLYIPMVNNILMFGCIFIVLIFQTSTHMEAAYGLAITITLLATSVLLISYLAKIKKQPILAFLYAIVFIPLETLFFVSCMAKFVHGGFVALLIAMAIAAIMIIWYESGKIERGEKDYVPVEKYIPQLEKLKNDSSLPRYTDNLVYLTSSSDRKFAEKGIFYSIFDKDIKRARTYWFVNVRVTSNPHSQRYKVETFGTNFVYGVTIILGFKENQHIDVYLKQIVSDLIKSNEFVQQTREYTVFSTSDYKKLHSQRKGRFGHFKYCMIYKSVSMSMDLSGAHLFLLTSRQVIRRSCSNPISWFGLESSSVDVEYIPVFVPDKKQKRIVRT